MAIDPLEFAAGFAAPVPRMPSALNAATRLATGFTDTPPEPLPPEARALLDVIAGTESAGRYNVIYGGSTFDDFSDHPGQYVEITSGPNKGKKSSAAGRYQFLERTYDAYAPQAGVDDFTPESQDRVAWALAQSDYKAATGRNLLADLQAGGESNMRRIANALNDTWTSLPGGIEQGQGQSRFSRSYNSALSGYTGGPVPPVGIPAPVPATPSALTATIRNLEPMPGPVPRPAFEGRIARQGVNPVVPPSLVAQSDLPALPTRLQPPAPLDLPRQFPPVPATVDERLKARERMTMEALPSLTAPSVPKPTIGQPLPPLPEWADALDGFGSPRDLPGVGGPTFADIQAWNTTQPPVPRPVPMPPSVAALRALNSTQRLPSPPIPASYQTMLAARSSRVLPAMSTRPIEIVVPAPRKRTYDTSTNTWSGGYRSPSVAQSLV